MSVKFIKDNIYILKKDYGRPITIYKKISTIDIKTGLTTISRTKVKINKAIVLPSIESMYGKESFEKTYLNTGRIRESLGGYIEIIDKIVILDKKDLPKTFDVNPDDYVVIDHQRFDIKAIDDYERIILALKQTTGQSTLEVIDMKIKQNLIIEQVCLKNIIRNIDINQNLNIEQTNG